MSRQHRSWLTLALTAVLCLAVLAPGQVSIAKQAKLAAARDWKTHPAIVEIDTKHDIYALGDIHADYDRLVTLLVSARLIQKDPATPEKVRWQAGRAVLVCTGDMIDKGDQALQVLALLRALQNDAARAGGRVVALAGNHEVELLAETGRSKKTRDFTKELSRKGIKTEDVVAGADALGVGAFLRGLPFAARVNDFFFAHACNTHGRSLKRLDRDLREGVDGKGYSASVLRAKDSLVEARLQPQPWWERSGDTAATARERLAGHAQALGVRHFVMGHQPNKVVFAGGGKRAAGELYQHFDGLIFLIDVGMSRGVGFSTGAILHLPAGKPQRAIGVFANGSTKQIWSASK
jgi:hypothetical protein